jgi:hypothetical protein
MGLLRGTLSVVTKSVKGTRPSGRLEEERLEA